MGISCPTCGRKLPVIHDCAAPAPPPPPRREIAIVAPGSAWLWPWTRRTKKNAVG